MKHHVIVKYNETVLDKEALSDEAEALFSGLVGTVPGVRGVVCHRNCIGRSNRYDLMIVIDIEKENLPDYDGSEIHHRWKSDYAKYLEKKCIFDCED